MNSQVKLTFLFFQLLLSKARSSSPIAGAVNVKFDSFRQENPETCDSPVFVTDRCDPFFIISVSTSAKVLGTFHSTDYDNAQRVLHFGYTIGQLSNPLQFPFDSSDLKPSDSLQLSINVMDKNPGSSSKMCSFSKHFSLPDVHVFANDSFNSSRTPNFFTLTSSSHKLNLAVWITCKRNFFQTGCSVHCDPTRFECSHNGSVICPVGFAYAASTDSCVPTDKCEQRGPSFCQNGGKCELDVRGEPVCRCPMSFTGPRCELGTHPCLRNATLCSRGVCRTFDSNDTSVCDCEKGFTGYHCDEDVNECQLLRDLCGRGGECENSVGSFSCVCRPGFTGSLCQLELPTTPRNGASTPLASLNHESASPFSQDKLALPIMLLAVLIIVLCAFGGIVAGLMLYYRKRSSRVELRLAPVMYHPNSAHPVRLEQPAEDPVESTYYEDVDNEHSQPQPPANAAPGSDDSSSGPPGIGQFSNPAYTAQSERPQLTLNSRKFSRKSSTASAQTLLPPMPPPRSPSMSTSQGGLDPYLTPK